MAAADTEARTGTTREIVTREALHRLFAEALAARPGVEGSVFVFEIDHRIAGPDGCNWYPLASIGAWRGDVTANLTAFRAVREALSARYNVEAAEDARGAGGVACGGGPLPRPLHPQAGEG